MNKICRHLKIHWSQHGRRKAGESCACGRAPHGGGRGAGPGCGRTYRKDLASAENRGSKTFAKRLVTEAHGPTVPGNVVKRRLIDTSDSESHFE